MTCKEEKKSYVSNPSLKRVRSASNKNYTLQKKKRNTTLIHYISFILDSYSSGLISLESLFIRLSIDALFFRIVSLGRVQG